MLKMMKSAAAAIVLLAAGVVSADTNLKGSGASFPNPVYQRWIGEFGKANPGVKIDYASVGSGNGIKDFTAKSVDFAGSDAPVSKKERALIQGEFFQIPTVAGAVVLAYNLPGFSGEVKLTGDLVAKIYLGEIKKWNDPALAAVNVGITLPSLDIMPVSRTDGSGTSFIFTNYLTTQSETFTTKVGPGKQPKFPIGVGGKGNEGVTQAVNALPGSIGYIELNYAIDNKIPFASIQNKAGKFVKATTEGVAAAGAAAATMMKAPAGLATNIWNLDGEKTYPISAFTYILVYKDLGYLGSEEKAQTVVKYLTWIHGPEASKLAADMSYAPLDSNVVAKVEETIKALTFSGKQVASN